ncbi:hypothetical protein VTO42DRAFT_4838 [Malbranchea cinnamomea]
MGGGPGFEDRPEVRNKWKWELVILFMYAPTIPASIRRITSQLLPQYYYGVLATARLCRGPPARNAGGRHHT